MTILVGVSGIVEHVGAASAAWTCLAWQQDMINSGNAKLLEVFVAIAAIALLCQAIVVVALGVGAYKAQQKVMAEVAAIKAKVMPLIEKSHGLVTDLTPEIKSITVKVNEITGKINAITGKAQEIAGHAEKIVAVAKDKVEEFSPTISDINAKVKQAVANADVTVQQANETVRTANTKTREQVERVNGMVSSALDATERFGKAVQYGISQPGREIAGLVSGARSSIDHLMESSGKNVSSGVTSVLSKVASLFATRINPAGKGNGFGKVAEEKAASAKPSGSAKPTPPQAKTPQAARPFGSMADLQTTIAGEMTPGVSSGTGTNGDPILS